MNGIVHPCSHPEHKPAPATEDEMFLDIFTYTDRVLLMARPRKVLMIAVDGVAPRAKMNQQRARRFRSAMDAQLKHEQLEKELADREARGEIIDDAVKLKTAWDSNAITPGTPFMDRLAQALRYWTAYKLSSDPGWANLQVIISDATVPGEGEHKLMSFIRLQRLDPQYDPNTRHCIYGLDADLIFLGLATHEPHFRVLREDVFANQEKPLLISQQMALDPEQRLSLEERDTRKPFLWLHVNVLREYLEAELYNPHLPFAYDLERAIDDWVFMCFFVGNDFLPHLPSLDVRDNGIDTLVNCWKRLLPLLRDFITCDGRLNLEGVEQLMAALAAKEPYIFQRRHESERRREDNNKRRKMDNSSYAAGQNLSKGTDRAPLSADVNMPLMTTDGKVVDGFANLSNREIVAKRDTVAEANMANASAAAEFKKKLANNSPQDTGVKRSHEECGDTDAGNEEDIIVHGDDTEEAGEEERLGTCLPDESGDSVQLWEPGFRTRYYQCKFGCATASEVDDTRRQVLRSYLEGISWVLLYYYQGCPSWQWYYPYHYAPFAADFTDCATVVGELGIKFSLGQPFRPYEQLMSVLPAASGHSLPAVFRDLMSNPNSDIIDFYPVDFKIDMNGKKMSWQGIALLPFIDEQRLLKSVQAMYPLLTDEECDRNTNKQQVLYISRHHPHYKKFLDQLYHSKSCDQIEFKFNRTSLGGMALPVDGFDDKAIFKFPLAEGEMPDLAYSDFLAVTYAQPPQKYSKSMLLNGYIPHEKALSHYDVMAMQQQQQQSNYNRNNNRNGNRFNSTPDNSDYVNHGPSGKDISLCYSVREGGYRSLTVQSSANAGRSSGGNGGNYYNQNHQNSNSQTFGYLNRNQHGSNQYGGSQQHGYNNNSYGNNYKGNDYGNNYGSHYGNSSPHNNHRNTFNANGGNSYNANNHGNTYNAHGNSYNANNQGSNYSGNSYGNSYSGNNYSSQSRGYPNQRGSYQNSRGGRGYSGR